VAEAEETEAMAETETEEAVAEMADDAPTAEETLEAADEAVDRLMERIDDVAAEAAEMEAGEEPAAGSQAQAEDDETTGQATPLQDADEAETETV